MDGYTLINRRHSVCADLQEKRLDTFVRILAGFPWQIRRVIAFVVVRHGRNVHFVTHAHDEVGESIAEEHDEHVDEKVKAKACTCVLHVPDVRTIPP